nr:retrovirus-related Pol polyprotein from transposon TNT 1-94 [Tanacetum cinerariifolium]
PLGKFKGKADEGFLVGYSVTSKAFRGIKLIKMQVYKTLMVMQILKIILMHKNDNLKDDTGSKTVAEPINKEDQAYKDELDSLMRTLSAGRPSSSHPDAFIPANTLLHMEPKKGIVVRNKARLVAQGHRQEEGIHYDDVFAPVAMIEAIKIFLAFASFMGFIGIKLIKMQVHKTLMVMQILKIILMHEKETIELQSTGIFNSAYDDNLDIYTSPIQSLGVEVDFNNMESSTIVSPIPTHKVHIDHPKDQILGDSKSAVQTKGMAKKSSRAHALMEPKKGIVVRNKARLVAQGHRQEEGIDYDDVFALVAMIEAIKIILAFASFMGFIVNQMDVKVPSYMEK